LPATGKIQTTVQVKAAHGGLSVGLMSATATTRASC
jgi:hypothetical protein